MNYTQSEEYLFNTMPVGRAIASLAVPTVISQIVTVIYNMADTFFVGQLGDPNQVAAATVHCRFSSSSPRWPICLAWAAPA